MEMPLPGYAVVDLETTGLRPSWHDRIIEVAIVLTDADGKVEATWVSLVNPERDLGPQRIHGISAADVRHAPTFSEIAGQLARMLAGRTLVAHNAAFDLDFLRYAYNDSGYDVPLVLPNALCTMRAANALLPGAPRSLSGCCEYLGIPSGTAHEALSDALATASLLERLIESRREQASWGPLLWWDLAVELAETSMWPAIPVLEVEPVVRGTSAARDTHFLSRLARGLKSTVETWQEEQYAGLLDRALIDRHLSAREHDALAKKAGELGISRDEARRIHAQYLSALIASAWVDGVVTESELADLRTVADLLGIEEEPLIAMVEESRPSQVAPTPPPRVGHFSLAPGSLVVFTGEMGRPRSEWEEIAHAAGYIPYGNVTKKVALVVAADPDSLSGKARKAEAYGIPIIGEAAFATMLAEVPR